MNNKALSTAIVLGCILVFSVCNAGSILNGLEDVGKIPKLDRTDTLAGIDNDKNGIRDDIDAYILKHYPMEEQRKAVNQLAKSFQASILVDTKDRVAVKKAANQNSRSISCIYSKFNMGDGVNGKVSREIFSITTNTKKRLLAYHELDEALDGSVISLQRSGFCDE